MLSNASLQTISFHCSPLCNEAFKQLILLIRNIPTVFHLDFSNCNLSSRSAVEIAETLKYQSLQHYTEGWKQSLRNQDPNLESMPGLRRIILNGNAQIGDEGVKYLAEVLKEDIWLKAIDLQNCGISNVGAQCMLDMLDINVTLYIVDLRDNKDIDDVFVHHIMLKLLYNNANKDAQEYSWTIPQSQLPSVTTSKSLAQSAGLRHISMKHKCQHPKQKISTCSIAPITPGLIRNQTSIIQYIPQLTETKQKLKELVEHLEVETSLRRKAELEQEALKTKINELEKELLKEKEEKEGYCFVKMDAYESILENLRKFSIFVEHIKEANETSNKDIDPNNDSRMLFPNDMKTLLETHVKKIIKVMTQEELNKLCMYLQKFPQEVVISLKVTEEEMSQSNNFSMCQKNLQEDKSQITERENKSMPNISKDFTCRCKMKNEQVAPVCSLFSSVAYEDNEMMNMSSVPANNCSDSEPLSKVKELYEQLIECNINKENNLQKSVHDYFLIESSQNHQLHQTFSRTGTMK